VQRFLAAGSGSKVPDEGGSMEKFAGIDWASVEHALCVVDKAGPPVTGILPARSTRTRAGPLIL
jgi:hypothetical protein